MRDEQTVGDEISDEQVSGADEEIDDVMLIEIDRRKPDSGRIKRQQQGIASELFIHEKRKGHGIGAVQRRNGGEMVGIEAAPQGLEKIHADHLVDIQQRPGAQTPVARDGRLAKAVAVDIPGRRRRIDEKGGEGAKVEQGHGPDEAVKGFAVIGGVPEDPADDDRHAEMEGVKESAAGIEQTLEPVALQGLLQVLEPEAGNHPAEQGAENFQLGHIGPDHIDGAPPVIDHPAHHVVADPENDPRRPVHDKILHAPTAEGEGQNRQGDEDMIRPHPDELVDQHQVENHPDQHIAAPAVGAHVREKILPSLRVVGGGHISRVLI